MPIVSKRAGQPSYISHTAFMQMLEPAWYAKEVNESNIMAVLKRTHLFVNTKSFLYIRPAGEDKQPVLRKPLNDKTDFLVDESRVIYDRHRKGATDLPADFETKLRWEKKWMEAAMSGKTGDALPTRTFVKNTRLFPELHENDDKEESKVDGMYSSSPR